MSNPSEQQSTHSAEAVATRHARSATGSNAQALSQWLLIALNFALLAMLAGHLWHLLTVPDIYPWSVAPSIAPAGCPLEYARLMSQPAPWWRTTGYRALVAASLLVLALGTVGQLAWWRSGWRKWALAVTALGAIGAMVAHLISPSVALEMGAPPMWGKLARASALSIGVLALLIAWSPAPPRLLRAGLVVAIALLVAHVLIPFRTEEMPIDYHRELIEGEERTFKSVAPFHFSVVPFRRLLEVYPLIDQAAADARILGDAMERGQPRGHQGREFQSIASHWRFQQLKIICLVIVLCLGPPLALLTLFRPRWPGRGPALAGLGLLGLVGAAFYIHPASMVDPFVQLVPMLVFFLAVPLFSGASVHTALHVSRAVQHKSGKSML